MSKVAVVTDSVACLPKELVDKYSITIVPIGLIINGHVYKDGVDITPTEVYRLVAANKSTPTTSSPTLIDFIQVYRELGKSVEGIVCVTICSDISMMFNSAIQAKSLAQEEKLPVSINVVDSRTAGGAQGFVALAAAKAAASGKDLAEATKAAELMIPRVNMMAVLDTLYYLAISGRIPKIAAWAGSMLKINPILTFAYDGIGLLERARTKPKAVNRLVEIMDERTKGKPVHVNIMHANVAEEAERLKERVESRFKCVELYITDFAPTMGVHAGPGTLALAFYSEEDSDVG
jgi:fatty acid kinase fatty acid binding subunit